ncbi:MAG: HdeD family acid-resistance protein [Anderseniella sp.]
MSGKIPTVIKDHWRRFVGVGVLLSLCGAVAMLLPAFTTIAIKYTLGVVFLFAAILHVDRAFVSDGWGSRLWEVLSAIALAVGGVLLLSHPLTGLLGITLLIALTLIFDGVFKLIAGLRLRPNDGWIWIVAAGIASIVLGVLIWNRLPSSAVTTVGILVGISLLLSGLSYLIVGLRARLA